MIISKTNDLVFVVAEQVVGEVAEVLDAVRGHDHGGVEGCGHGKARARHLHHQGELRAFPI